MLADTSLTNKHLIHNCFQGEGLHSFDVNKQIALSEIMHKLIGVPRTLAEIV